MLLLVKAEIGPEPEADNPMELFELVQLKVEPESVLVKFTLVDSAPLHKLILGIALNDGIGLTLIV